MKTILTGKGYTWCSAQGVFFRGYLQKDDGTLLRGEEACAFLAKAQTLAELTDILRETDGVFALIIQKEGRTLAAVDRARSMPLYYSREMDCISDSSEAVRVYKNISREEYAPLRVLELYSTAYVAHANTAYDAIKQIDIASAVEMDGIEARQSFYFRHGAQSIVSVSEEEAMKNLEMLTKEAMESLKKVVGKRQIVLSLSGGYDSRYVACSLKNAGFDNVFCYTYGAKDSFEIRQSKRVAEALGYKWHCVEYDDSTRDIIKEKDYIDYCATHDFTLYIQNYIAVRELTQKRMIDRNAVFMTGLCNDMPTGSYIPEEALIGEKYGFTMEGFAQYVVDTRFVRTPLRQKARERLVSETVSYVEKQGIQVKDYASFVSALDTVQTSYDHSKRFLNMNKSHEFFGHEWLLPCWNKNLLSFWYALPAQYRIGQNLYEKYITSSLAKQYGVGEKKIKMETTKPGLKGQVRRLLGGIAARALYTAGIPVRRKADFNNFAPLELELHRRIKQKRAINYKRAAITMLLNIFILEQRYGTRWYDKIKGFLA